MKTPDSCNGCGSEFHQPWATVNGCPLVRCLECGLIYQYPPPELTFLKNLYSTQASGYHADLIQENQAVLAQLAPDQQHCLELVQQKITTGKLLDIGCSTGLFIERCAKAGFEVTGFETNETAVAYARQRGLNVQTGSLSVFTDSQFDVITLMDVLEHVPNPLYTLAECWRLLRPGGYLFVHCPNVDSFLAVLTQALFYPVTKQWAYSEAPYHIFEFSPHTLNLMFHQVGFRLLDVVSFDGSPELMWGRMNAVKPDELKHLRQQLPKQKADQVGAATYQAALSYLLNFTYQQLITEATLLADELGYGSIGMFVSAQIDKDEMQPGRQVYHQLAGLPTDTASAAYQLPDLRVVFQMDEAALAPFKSTLFLTASDLGVYHLQQRGFSAVQKKRCPHATIYSERPIPSQSDLGHDKAFHLMCLYTQDNVSSWKETLAVFIELFAPEDDVELVLYVMASQYHEQLEEELTQNIQAIGADLDAIPSITLLPDPLPPKEEFMLFEQMNVIVFPLKQIWGYEPLFTLLCKARTALITYAFDQELVQRSQVLLLASFDYLCQCSPLDWLATDTTLLKTLLGDYYTQWQKKSQQR